MYLEIIIFNFSYIVINDFINLILIVMLQYYFMKYYIIKFK